MPMATSESTMMAAAAATIRPPLRPLPLGGCGGTSFMVGLRRFAGSATPSAAPLPLSRGGEPRPAASGTYPRTVAQIGRLANVPSGGIRRRGERIVAAPQILRHVDEEAAAADGAEPGLAREAQHRQVLAENLRRECAQAQPAGVIDQALKQHAPKPVPLQIRAHDERELRRRRRGADEMSDGQHLAAGEGGKRLVLRVVYGEELGTQVRAVELHQPGEAQPQILALELGGEGTIGLVIGGRWRANLERAELRQLFDAGVDGRQWTLRLRGGIDLCHGVSPSPDPITPSI